MCLPNGMQGSRLVSRSPHVGSPPTEGPESAVEEEDLCSGRKSPADCATKSSSLCSPSGPHQTFSPWEGVAGASPWEELRQDIMVRRTLEAVAIVTTVRCVFSLQFSEGMATFQHGGAIFDHVWSSLFIQTPTENQIQKLARFVQWSTEDVEKWFSSSPDVSLATLLLVGAEVTCCLKYLP